MNKNNYSGKIFIICGPSGVGKGTVISGLLKQKNIPLTIIPTYTTRPPKPRDLELNYHKYITKQDFFDLSKNKQIFESNYYNKQYYATLKKDIDNIILSSKLALREQDVSHALFTKKHYPEHVTIIFINSSAEIIRQRLLKRGEDSQEEITRRLSAAKKEISLKEKCDYIIENLQNDQENTIKKVLEIIKKEINI